MKRWLGISLLSMALPAWAELTATTIQTFSPTIPSQPVKEGVCWNSSLLLPRFGAWVCGVGGVSYDPCFSAPNVTDAVVCDANPVTQSAGFRLKLSQPLPFSMGLPALPGEAWILQLENGLNCSKAPAPPKIIDGVGTIDYLCDEAGLPDGMSSGILHEMNLGTIWGAHLVHFTFENGQYLAKDMQQVQVKSVWR